MTGVQTCALPILLLLLLRKGESEERELGDLVKAGLSWCAGYGGMWVLKWVLGSLITGTNVLADGVGAFARRASYTATENVSRVDAFSCLRMNYEAFFFTPVTFLAVAFLLWLLWHRAKKSGGGNTGRVQVLFPFFIVGLAPVAWHLFAANHSTVHCYFTNKACVVSFLALLFGAVEIRGQDSSRAGLRELQQAGHTANSGQP